MVKTRQLENQPDGLVKNTLEFVNDVREKKIKFGLGTEDDSDEIKVGGGSLPFF